MITQDHRCNGCYRALVKRQGQWLCVHEACPHCDRTRLSLDPKRREARYPQSALAEMMPSQELVRANLLKKGVVT